MHGRRAMTALAALSGASVVGSLAGCAVAPSMSAHALAEAQAAVGRNHSSHAPTPHPVIFDTETPTPDPTGTASTASKTSPTSTPAPHSSGKPKSSPSPSPSPTPTPTPTYQYTDGTYSSRGSYSSPGGHETLRVTLTIANDVIKTLEVTSVHVDSTAQQYETMFESGIDAVTVGHNLADLNVGAVGGSSLTCAGFNAAIANIQHQAQI